MDPLTRPVRPVTHRKQRKPLSEEIRSVYRLLSVTILLMAIGTTGAYLYTNSLKPAKGYVLQDLNLEQEALESEQRRLDHELIQAQSFIEIEDNEVLEQMEESSSLYFQYVDDSDYASR